MTDDEFCRAELAASLEQARQDLESATGDTAERLRRIVSSKQRELQNLDLRIAESKGN